MKKTIFLALVVAATSFPASAQEFIKDVQITTDSATFSLKETPIEYRKSAYLYFVLKNLAEVVAVKIIPQDPQHQMSIRILPTPNIEVVDSLIRVDDGSYVGTIRFNDILSNPYSRMVLSTIINHKTVNKAIRLYPFIFPSLPDIEPSVEVYSGQEVKYAIPMANPYLIKPSNGWQKQGIVEYRVVVEETGPELILHVKRTGTVLLHVQIESYKPFLDKEGLLSYDVLDFHLNIRAVFSKVNYLNFDKQSYYFEPQGAKLISVKFDNNHNIRLNRTYRIEDQEKPGGRLIGELFTRAIIENQNKVVGSLRTYALHRVEEGYLYMKLGDETMFFTNFNILKKPEITRLMLLRKAQDWNASHIVYPGETLDLKFEGVGLESSTLKFSDGKYPAIVDTSRTSENVLYCSITIPVDVKERTIPITLNGHNTAFELLVKEYERPRPLDFVTLNYGGGNKVVNSEFFIKPALYDGEIGDLIIHFNEEAIDEGNKFYGIQYLEVEVRYWDKNKKLIESRTVEDIKIVPGESSVRHEGYSKANAANPMIRLNDIMVNKTHELRPWSRIELTIRHDKANYGGEGYSEHVQIYRSAKFTVAVEVSFPAGLLAKRLDEPGIGSLTGLSVASMAQVSFYKKNEINKLNPLSVGLGFIFLNAFSSLTRGGEDQGDIGMVSLIRFQPLHADSKVNFPLYAGLGYLFKSDSMFLLIGPGIQFNF